jgi:3-deoxy-manno-octulosonate cytidylyltransferase (CMP-KDO synthetase)
MALPCIVAVPARLESSRLPGKVMADIGGKPMLQRVLERCGQAMASVAVLLCTDSSDLAAAASSWGFDAILTSSAFESGSERIASIADQLLAHGGSHEPTSSLNHQCAG